MFAISKRVSAIWTLAGLMALSQSAFAAQRVGKENSLKSLTDQSDAIVVGKVNKKNVQWVGKSLETTYEVEVRETLKGNSYKNGQALSITLPGGELTTPPLTQYIELVPMMYQGEDVALFLRKPKEPPAQLKGRIHPKSKVWASPQVVGWYEGKFTLYKDKNDGREKITRINTEKSGLIPQSHTIEKLVRAIVSGDAEVTSGPVVDLGNGMVTTPEGKELLDRATKAAAELQKDDGHGHAGKKKDASPADVDPLKPRKALVVQDFEDFKAQVRKLAGNK